LPDEFPGVVSLVQDSEAQYSGVLKINPEYRKDPNNECVKWFVENILSSVNTCVTGYKNNKSKKRLSEIFSPTDEAFALLIIENELERWNAHQKKGEKENEKDKNVKQIKKKFVDGASGKKGTGAWSKAGMRQFSILCKQVKEIRFDSIKGEQFEDGLLSNYLTLKQNDEVVNNDFEIQDEEVYIYEELVTLMNCDEQEYV